MLRSVGTFFLSAVFAAALCCAVRMDIRCKRVKRWVWWWGGSAALLLFAIRMWGEWETGRGIAAEIAVFIGLQFSLFARMYGKADCFAFSCCSVFLGAFGGGLSTYLTHMLFSIVLLGTVQVCQKNVNRQGNLKEPVAFLPYIAVAFGIQFRLL